MENINKISNDFDSFNPSQALTNYEIFFIYFKCVVFLTDIYEKTKSLSFEKSNEVENSFGID